MPPERHPKRQRKKEAAEARRQARIAAAQRRRRQRQIGLVVLIAILIVGGGALAFMATRDTVEDVAADATPTPTPDTPVDAIACDGELPPAAETEKPSFEAPEDQGLQPDTTYVLRLETSCGTIDIGLDHARAPQTANSIVFLARQGFFDGLTLHRVIPGFVIQGGDPEGVGTGDAGYKVEEAPPADLAYTKGIVAMAKAQPEPAGTSGSQFFIVTGDDAGLAAEFALLGEVVAGMEVAEEIETLGTAEGPPTQTIYIKTATIIEN